MCNPVMSFLFCLVPLCQAQVPKIKLIMRVPLVTKCQKLVHCFSGQTHACSICIQ